MINIECVLLKYVSVIVLFVCFASAFETTEYEHRNVASKVVLALQKTALFYRRSYSKLNLDGIFGLRVTEGVIENLLTYHKEYISKFSSVHSTTKRVFTVVHEVGMLAIQELEMSNTGYYKSFKRLLQNIWFYQPPLRPFNKKLVLPVSVGEEKFSEEKSDKCMSNILGSQGFGMRQKCKITDECWDAVTTKGTGGYFLTHQALYFIVADIVGCKSLISDRLKYDVDELFTDYGSNIFSQMKDNIDSTETDQDLFLEQVVVCNWLGIDSCNKMKWIKESIEWQDESGCVRVQDEETEPASTKFVGPARKPKEDVVLKDGCSAHTTGLYMAYLAMSLHWLLTHNDDHLKTNLLGFKERTCLVIILFVLIALLFRYYFRNRRLRSVKTMLHIL